MKDLAKALREYAAAEEADDLRLAASIARALADRLDAIAAERERG